ncbi:MAG: 16S rRNA (cytosine(1402)-N(4))-methyltransferase RsmH [Spirochaetales bacterium]
MKLVHTSVMVEEVLHFLAPTHRSSLLIDCTVGEGGHAEAFLHSFPDLRIVGIDADGSILQIACDRLRPFGDRFQGIESWYDEFFSRYPLNERPDRILFDLGISSYHYERSGRGFSFSREEPLDMRLSATVPQTAMDLVNTLGESELTDLFYKWGEERWARKIARALIQYRQTSRFSSAKQLAEVIRQAVPAKARYGRLHPATRCFQALRISVNAELERLNRALPSAFELLKEEGRMGVISFHSLEDRIVKHFFKKQTRGSMGEDELPISNSKGVGAKLVTRKPIRPNKVEVKNNPASRSAKLRVIEKILREGQYAEV